jgi:hypothetical protein
MTKVVYTKLSGATARQITTKLSAVPNSRSAFSNRKRKTATINVNAGTFGDDLTIAFGKNVAAARRVNKKLFGTSDSVPAKA